MLHVKGLSERLGLDERDVEARLRKWLAQAKPGPAAAAGAGDPSVPARKPSAAPCLEEVLLECLIAEPETAAERLGQIPPQLWPFSGENAGELPEGLAALGSSIEERARDGRFDAAALIGSLADEHARLALLAILARIDRMAAEGGKNDGNGVWKNCLRDLERKSLERRMRALRREMDQARQRKEAGLDGLQKEFIEIQRRLKGSNVRGRSSDAVMDHELRGEFEKGKAS
jgi:hypothetical protein